MTDISIIIVSYNTKKLLKECIDSVIALTKNISYEIIIVDNDSQDGSKKYLREVSKLNPVVRAYFLKTNEGFGGGNNYGMARAKGRYILLLNSDTYLTKDIFKQMCDWMDTHPKTGILTCALKNQDTTYQGTGGYFPTLPRVASWMFFLGNIPSINRLIKPFHPLRSKSPFSGISFYTKSQELDWVTGAFLLMRKDVYTDVGDFDRDYFMYTEEVDYCYRAKEYGWRVVYDPQWEIVHIGGASSTNEFPLVSEFKGVKTFYKKHMPHWQYPVLRVLLKAGALIRVVVGTAIAKKDYANVYKKAFRTA